MPHIHLPVQSGSNKILRSMNRKHNIEDYLKLIKKLKKINSKIKFSSDFIIGYPGETDEDFNATLKLLKDIKYISSYSFIYSSRPGTPASIMKKDNENILKKRLAKFQKAAKKIKVDYKKSLIKKKLLVLFENKVKGKDEFFGRDEFSNGVIVKSTENLVGVIKRVEITDSNQNTLFGVIEQKSHKKQFAA